ncbi:hypothetical protein [Streptomyces sp. CB03911]|uniref:hypothetical protein n=1 Tax=Streptomyces sp. CB03911 TaxID=1804758 RepID=UPI00093CACFA|nr:hypothetical protein [Streptomyces sp. CB03911]OKI26127.1 hypothetical protein A6A07_29525 [Streptomyces sp. CB03911]
MSAETTLEKARRVRTGVRAINEDQKDEVQRRHVAKRVQDISDELGKLENHLRTAVTFAERTGIELDVSYVSDGHGNLSKLAAGGLPSNPAFVAAQRKLESSARKLAEELRTAWADWCQGQLGALPLDRRAGLLKAQRDGVEKKVKDLKGLQAPKGNLDRATIVLFAEGLSGLQEILEEAEELAPAVAKLLDRIESGVLTLADVTDEEIALLQGCDLAADIRLIRKAG